METTASIRQTVEEELQTARFIDVHTHLFKPALGELGLWGIDELLTYHYLEAELFRSSEITPEQYWALAKPARAHAIWKTLFVENTPVSEATRGVVAVLNAFGLPSQGEKALTEARNFFAAQQRDDHIRRVFEMAGIDQAVMTNDPLDPAEAPLWEAGTDSDKLFLAVLRLDRILEAWPENWRTLAEKGFNVDLHLSCKVLSEVRRFLANWCRIMHPIYMAVSLPDTFQYPEESVRAHLLEDAVLPVCREFKIPLSLMIGVRRQVNPAIRLAGDAAGKADLRSLENLCRNFPENNFLASVLSRENQHELCVYARKFRNLLPFGCWWFLNNPSVVEEITRERIEMLGMSFIPQHSDARVLEQVIYKWRNTRRTLAPILANTYTLLMEDGGHVTREHVRADIERLFRGNLERFCRLKPQ
ncbi:MAG: hypothetical protein JO319_04860 [Acidobacteriaceae bacterium]|nr:hypothetical protein [Acidobacteriaceae bacterium]